MRVEGNMRSLVAVLIVTLLAAAYTAYAETSYTAYVRLTGRIENGYVVLFLNMSLPAPTSTLEFNISRHGDRIVLAWAETDRGGVLGRISDEILRIDVDHRRTSFYVILVIDAISTNSTHVNLEIPVPLSPLGSVCRIEGSITLGATFSGETSYGNFSGGVIRYNMTIPPGSLDMVRASALLSNVQLARITYLNRTIYLSPDRVIFLDTYTLKSEGLLPVSTFMLTLPAGYELEGVGSGLFSYPERYISKHSSDNSTLVVIYLLTSLQAPGQEAKLDVKYSTAFSEVLNAFMGLGVFVKNYSVNVCLQGVAQLPSHLVLEEKILDSTRCYRVKTPGPIFRHDTYPGISVSASFASSQAAPAGALTALLAVGFLAVAAGYVAITRQRRGSPGEGKAELLVRRESETKARELLEKRVENISIMLDQLREYRSRGTGIVRVIDLVQSCAKRDAELHGEISRVLSSLGPRGGEISERVEAVSNELAAAFRELLETERMFRRGRMDKQEYKKRVETLEGKIMKLAGELGKIARTI